MKHKSYFRDKVKVDRNYWLLANVNNFIIISPVIKRFSDLKLEKKGLVEMGTDKEFVEHIIKEIVDYPDDVQVDRKVDEMGVLISLTVNPQDMGQVVGKQGSTAKSIRTLLRVIGAKNNARVNFKIIEPEGSRRERFERNDQNKEVKETNVDDVVNDLKL